jgi:hypothetical protein
VAVAGADTSEQDRQPPMSVWVGAELQSEDDVEEAARADTPNAVDAVVPGSTAEVVAPHSMPTNGRQFKSTASYAAGFSQRRLPDWADQLYAVERVSE